MSSERQRNMRLQGRFSGPPQKSSARKSASPLQGNLRQSLSPHQSPDTSSTNQRESLSPRPLLYTQTDVVSVQEAQTRPSEPIRINDDPEKFRRWFPISESDNGISWLYFDPGFLSRDVADSKLAQLLALQLPWQEREVVIQGERHAQPRLVHWIGPYEYKYSSVSLRKNIDWPEVVKEILSDIEEVPRYSEDSQGGLNSVLLNLYRHEKDSVSWHSDNELSMGVRPFIASVSLGETRRFQLKRNVQATSQDKAAGPEYVVHLDHGSLLIMNGALQNDWLHRVPKDNHSRGKRINLTFRTVFQT